jgi:hypothetical protein
VSARDLKKVVIHDTPAECQGLESGDTHAECRADQDLHVGK